MLPLTPRDITSSFINASRSQLSDLTLPANFASLDWDQLDFLGWRDPKLPRRGYAIVQGEDGPVGILLQQAEAKMRARALCSWCQDITLDDDVVFYGVRRAGKAGRNGNTVGTLICTDFGCSRNARKLPAVAYLGFDVEAARDKQIETLRERVNRFVLEVKGEDS
ncbi:FBP domain-containing protein [Mycetocola zhadangensis]|uniref:FBP domain-containing protein n=1 Tax=Mycetocola zhadangensis TaxID=1164595 RepID=UPI003A4DCD9D